MIENMKNLTTNFIENEKGFLCKETDQNFDEDKYPDQSQIVETVNQDIIHENLAEELSEISIITGSKTDFSGISPKRYTTTCFVQSRQVPYWYTESILLFINSTKKKYEDKVYFKNKRVPVWWAEKMSTEISLLPNAYYRSSIEIPVPDIYIPLDQPEA